MKSESFPIKSINLQQLAGKTYECLELLLRFHVSHQQKPLAHTHTGITHCIRLKLHWPYGNKDDNDNVDDRDFDYNELLTLCRLWLLVTLQSASAPAPYRIAQVADD